MRFVPHASSIQARYTIVVTLLSLIVLAVIGVSVDLVIRYRVEVGVFQEAEQVAGQWSAAARNGTVPHTIPAFTRIDLIQLVDSHDRVLDASRAAAGLPALSRRRPPPDDRFNYLTECRPRSGCVIMMAIRVTPAPDSGVIYAGMAEPRVLATDGLEYGIVSAAVVITIVVAWMTWIMIGRTLLPVAAIRARMAEITASDLSLRVPLPPGRDEIALLARTANQTLDRLEGAVQQQRQFASDTSHELRTPIAGLRTQLEEAVLYPDDVDPHTTIQAALTTTDRLEAIVSDLLVLARLRATDPAPPESVDLGALVREETRARVTGIGVEIQQAPGVWVRGSRIQLIRVMDNLLDNARRHAESAVEVTVAPVGGQAVVTVTDDGVGIAPADRERVFERFTRLADGRTRDPGGSGLGLAISRDIAHAHNGTLRAEESPHGARFVLRLPLLDTERGEDSSSRNPVA